ncbi:hypothetical protein KOR34_12110 [Posidoniimonas corsicana]|uniref:Inverse autotransporter beta-domain domain-containing protein n=1 Tax=Posidoniimonas corsicana TaxID=1938618 RepID=A0A5C5VEC1_9BACT|nr:S-layer family protein [Posidoniimonas corsicana]TWT36307.1 hypothetical protein KOR34_12110 [Posidoniimonas corsicana]
MPVRCSLAALAVALCLCSSSASAQEGSSGGTLSLPPDLFGTGDTGAAGSTPSRTMSSGVTGSELPPAAPYGGPSSYSGGGMSYSPSLGGHLRAQYNTKSYGQSAGNLDLGTMFMQQDGDRAWFLDGQVTLNDESKVGFNLGLGARTIIDIDHSLLGDNQKVLGVSIWADGSSTQNDNFFPQLGLSGELLGERWDLRANASFVLENQTLLGETQIAGDGLGYSGFNIGTDTLTGRDNAMHLTELEAARRVGNNDFWAFAGGYGLYGGDGVDTAGYQLGVRGFATPDLALQLKVTDDDLFATNTVFSITWFIGRTRTNTQFCGDLTDRFRERVIRNDYVPVYQDQVAGQIDQLTHDFDGDGESEAIRVVHVDSNAAAGGDGSFENPLQSLDSVQGASQDGDIVLVHANTTYADQTATLQDFQRLLGEGNDLTFNINTDQFGTIALPESSDGAMSGVSPIINNTAASAAAVVLANDNEVAGFTINGGVTAIDGSAGAGNPNLHDLTINGTTGDAIVLTPAEIVDGSDTTIAFNATLDNITFDSVGGNDISIDAATTADPSSPNVTLNEAISITNITSTNNGATSLAVSNTHSGGTLDVNGYDWDGGGSGLVGMSFTTTAGMVDVINSSLTGGAAGAVGFSVSETTGTVAIGSSNTVTNINGQAAEIYRNEESVDFAATVNNTTTSGGTVTITENAGAVTVQSASITTQDATSIEINDAAANVTVSSDVTRNGTAGIAVAINDTNPGDDDPNDDIVISFSDPTSTIESNGGSMAVVINGGDDEVNFLGAIEDTGGIRVTNRTGGEVTFSGGVTSDTGTADAVAITSNADDAVVTFDGAAAGLDITTSSGRGFFADSGEVNVTGSSNTITTTAATTGGLVLQGTPANPITSTSGVTFASVDTAAGSTNAIVLANVEGNVTVNGGTLNTAANAAVQIDNATGLTLNDVQLASGGATAVTASYSNDVANGLSLNDVDMNDGAMDVTANTTAAAAGTTVSVSSTTEAGAMTFTNNGTGDLDAILNDVTGSTGGAVSLDVTGAGDGSLAMSDVDTNGGTVSATSSGAASGDLALTMTDSGNTNEFGAITVNDQGSGNVSALLSNVETSSTLDFDAASGGTASLTVTGGAYNGAVTADAANTGTFTATINGGADLASTLDVNAGNTGVATVSVGGASTIDGAVNVTATNTGNATVTVNGGSTIDDSLTVNATNTGTATVNVNGNSSVTGVTTINTGNTGAANVDLDGTFGDQVTVAATNTEDFNFEMSSSTVTAGAAATALDVSIGDSVNNASLDFVGNTYDSGVSIAADNSQAFGLNVNGDSVTTGDNTVAFALLLDDGPSTSDIQIANSSFDTNDAVAFDFDNPANTGSVRFWLDNNDFENESATLAAADLTVGAGALDITVGISDSGGSGNSFTNNANATSQFLLTANTGSTVDMRYNGNSHNGAAGNYEFDNTDGVSFEVFDLANANGDFQNSGTFVPTPNAGAFTDTNVNPDLPNP